MTDEELIKRLSKGIADIDQQQYAADRIEALIKERDDLEATAIQAATVAQDQRSRAEAAEAALKEAVELLKTALAIDRGHAREIRTFVEKHGEQK